MKISHCNNIQKKMPQQKQYYQNTMPMQNAAANAKNYEGRYSKLPDTLNFLGTFYAASDNHTRVPMTAAVLSEIERIKPDNEPVFFLDCGDSIGENYSLESMADTYTTFKKRNPDIEVIFNFGNVDLSAFYDNGLGDMSPYQDKVVEAYKKMSDAGIKFVSASYCFALEDIPKRGLNYKKLHFIKPYTMIKDIVDGKEQNILVTGVSVNKSNLFELGVEEEKKALKYAKKCYRKDGIEPDKIILMLHDIPNKANELLEYAKKELGMENVELVIGGHPHSIEDYTVDNTRVLYPPAQGKGAYKIKNDEDGFHFTPLVLKDNHYDYSPLKDNPDVIDNSDINNPLDINEEYNNILKSPINAKFTNIITGSSPYSLQFRNYDEKLSTPTTFGTYISNKFRDALKCDIGICKNQHLREVLPENGKPINWYNIIDAANMDFDLYRIKDCSIELLKEMFEVSLQKQNMGLSNPTFLEYSDNLRVTRKTNPKDGEDKVLQIEIKENGEWVKLLNEDGKAKYPERTFTIATDRTLALSERAEYQNLHFDAKKAKEGLTIRTLLAESLKNEIQNPDEPNYHASELISA